jgi:hypothetical protein
MGKTYTADEWAATQSLIADLRTAAFERDRQILALTDAAKASTKTAADLAASASRVAANGMTAPELEVRRQSTWLFDNLIPANPDKSIGNLFRMIPLDGTWPDGFSAAQAQPLAFDDRDENFERVHETRIDPRSLHGQSMAALADCSAVKDKAHNAGKADDRPDNITRTVKADG